ncbi:MAG: M20 family metallopeptidase [Solirubrobacteraceae bacterium]|nr:MAG: peptidase M20 [Solirubrobacterales bacterium]
MERTLAERLISYDTSRPEGLAQAAGFVKGWLQSRDVDANDHDHKGLPVITAEVGPAHGPSVIFHGHLDVVPGHREQFDPRVEGDRLIGRGAYDMKGALAAMMCGVVDAAAQSRVRVRFLCVPDEESEDVESHATDALIREGYGGDFAITGEPTDMQIGVQAKGVLAMRILVGGTAAHSATPWLGDNAVLKAVDVFRVIESLPFTRQSSELFDRPSINLGRIRAGDALNMVPDSCVMDVDVRYLPGQEPEEILEQVAQIADVEVTRTFVRAPAQVSRDDEFIQALGEAVRRTNAGEVMSVGRDGASDAVAFLQEGIPAVEFGPAGAGHHGPLEWVSISSLARYRRALGDFVRQLPERLDWQRDSDDSPPVRLRALGGGRA